MSATYGYDNLYNEHINDIALLNYNKGIANRLRSQEQQMERYLPFKEPKLLSGGVRASNTIQPGTGIEAVPRAVGGRAFRSFTGKELPSQGGVNRLKKANRYLDFSKKVVGDAFGIYDEAQKRGAGSGGVNRLKKANRWLDFSKKAVGDAFDVASMAGMGTGGVNRLKKANRYLDFSKKVVGDAFGIYDQAKARGAGKLVYSPELQKALGGCGECEGGVKPRKPRAARFAKGSQEAKAWGAMMQAARAKKNKKE